MVIDFFFFLQKDIGLNFIKKHLKKNRCLANGSFYFKKKILTKIMYFVNKIYSFVPLD